MSTKTSSLGIHGVDPAVIEAAIRRGRLERSKALWALLYAVFGRSEPQTLRQADASREGAAAHC